jgi:hypothetical protein
MSRLGLAIGLGAALASAQALDLPHVEVAGFGSLAAYQGDDPVAAVSPGTRNPRHSRDGRWRADGDSVLGLQMRLPANDSTEAVWQLQASDELGRRFRPTTHWLYVGWQLSPDWRLRVGRQPLPLLLASENAKVGYAHTAMRPMPAVYSLNGNNPTDALTLSWAGQAGGGNLLLDLASGRNHITLTRGRIDVRASHMAALRWQRGTLALRAGAASFRFNVEDSALARDLATLTQPQSGCSNCAQRLAERAATRDVRGGLATLALVWIPGPYNVTAELTRRGGNSVFSPEATGWYAQLAKRHGDWTPYAAVGETRFHETPLQLQATAGAAASLQPRLDLLDRSLQSPFDRRILLAGLRWDLLDGVALKAQAEHWTALRDSSTPRGGDIELGPGQAWDGRVRMLSFSLDFVF